MDTVQPNETEPMRQSATIDIDVDAPAEEVWKALTTSDGLAPWLGAGAEIDAQPGGRIAAPDPVTDRPKTGQVHTVVEHEALGFVWWPNDDPERTSDVRITITPQHHRSEITITETQPPTANVSAVMCTTTAGSAQAPGLRPTEQQIRASWAWRAALIAVVGQPAPLAPPIVVQPQHVTLASAGTTVVYC